MVFVMVIVVSPKEFPPTNSIACQPSENVMLITPLLS